MRYLVSFVTITAFFFSQAQNPTPHRGEVFDDSVLPKVYISLPADSLAEILDPANKDSNYEYLASFVFDDGTSRDTIEEVGFRLRGNTSRKAQKKSYKVSFNSKVSGQKFHGLEKMNLNGEHNDPSIIRAKLCFDFLYEMEVPASRVNHVELYINGEYYGLYLNVEHLDEEFTKQRFGGEGPLYKCLYGANLAYRGKEGSQYDLPYYELKERKGAGDYDDLAHFIDVLNNTPDEDYVCELEKVFNVDRYLKSVVMDVLTGNWDGPNYNQNNFYLYHNLQTRRMEYIPYDLDNTFGIDFIGRDWSTRNIYNWSKGTSGRPLFDKILKHQEFRDRYTYWMNEALEQYFNLDTLSPKILQHKSLIQNAAERDSFRTLDYGFSINDFNNSYNYFEKEHVKQGLVDYINRRVKSTENQLDAVTSIGLRPMWHHYEIDQGTDSVTFYLHLDGDTTPDKVVLQVNWDYQSAIWPFTMTKDPETGMYEVTLKWREGINELEYWYELEMGAGTQNLQIPSCEPSVIKRYSESSTFYINEFMASNQSGITDEEGKTEDWVEIYYDGTESSNLRELYITDDINDPYKFAFTAKTVLPKSFILFWADSDEQDGIDHLNFKLSSAGEELALFTKEGALIDYISFGEQIADVSYGREKDGIESWVSFTKPTPRISNEADVNGVDELDKKQNVYPNLFNDELYLDLAPKATYQVIDMSGRILVEGDDTHLSTSDWQLGVYLFIITTSNENQSVHKLLKVE